MCENSLLLVKLLNAQSFGFYVQIIRHVNSFIRRNVFIALFRAE